MHTLTLRILPPLALCCSAAAQSARMEVTDAAAPIPGMTIVTALPPSGTPASVARAPGPTYSQLPGWPKTVTGHVNFSTVGGVAFVDLDGDGPLEIVMSSTDGQIHAWDAAGNDMPGFPVPTIEIPQYVPSVGDLDGDGDLEIVQLTRGFTSGGRMYIVDHEGNVLPGFPKSFGNNNLKDSPTLFDLDDDGDLEILVPERDWPIGRLHVVEMDGSEWGGNWPVQLDHVPVSSSAVADVDGDGAPEIVYLSLLSVYVLETDGTPLPGWPQSIPNAQFSYESPALADLDDDGDLEIAVGTYTDASGYYVFEHDGTLLAGWPNLTGTWTYCPPSIGDVDGDGDLEILGGREGSIGIPSAVFWVWNVDGSTLPGFPYVTFAAGYGGGAAGPLTLLDLEGDGQLEILTDHNILENGSDGYLFGVDSSGADLPGFPLRPRGFTYRTGATIADVDGDGDVELGVVSRLGLQVDVNLYDLPHEWRPSRTPWETYHKYNRRGGEYEGGHKLHAQGEWSAGSEITLHQLGDPGAAAFIAFSFLNDQVPFPGGWWYLGAPFRRILNGDAIPASGEVTLSLTIPPLIGSTVYLQGTVVDGTGAENTNLIGRIIE